MEKEKIVKYALIGLAVLAVLVVALMLLGGNDLSPPANGFWDWF